MEINLTELSLEAVYENLSQGETWDLANLLKGTKESLLMDIDRINAKPRKTKRDEELIDKIKKQNLIIDKNVIVVEDALLCFETQTFEMRTIMGQSVSICQN